MPAVACPGCGAVIDMPAVTRSSEEFCPSCDFPLFWAGGTRVEDEAALGMALRRRPGAGGRQMVATETCPACQERNKPSNVYCQRCGAEMHPAPPPVIPTVPPAPTPPPLPTAPPPPAPAPPPPARRPWWRGWIVLAILFGVLAALVVASLILLALRS